MNKRRIAAIVAGALLALVVALGVLRWRSYGQTERIIAMERMEHSIAASLADDLRPKGVEPSTVQVKLIEVGHPRYTGLVTYYDADGREVSRTITVTVDDRRDSFIWRLER